MKIYPFKDPRSENEKGIAGFIRLIWTPLEFSKFVEQQPNSNSLLIDSWLQDTYYIIEYANYEGAEKVETRYFFPRPNSAITLYVEMGKEMINWDVWKRDWQTVKVRCDVHVGDRHWWVVRLLGIIDLEAERREVPAVERAAQKFDPIFDEG